MVPGVTRATRSGRCFGDWNSAHVTTANLNFNFSDLFQASLDREDSADDHDADTFGSSPLTTPKSTPPSSPRNSPSPISGLSLTPTEQDELTNRKARQRAQKHANRKKRRASAKEGSFGGPAARPAPTAKYVHGATPLKSDFNVENANVASTGYVGLDGGTRDRKVYGLEDVVGDDSKFRFHLQEWDGRTPMRIEDQESHVIGVCAGQPEDENWEQLHRQAAEALEQARSKCPVPKKEKVHRRGAFTALRCGVSHGGGQKRPTNVQNNARTAAVLEELNHLKPFQRLAGFASSVLATWAPDLHQHIVEQLGALYAHDPSLRPSFNNSIFPTTTYNLGPRTVCFKHFDFANLPFGWCAITALGSFDPKKGGHLILWDCHLVLEFPPGSTILIPSALIAHSNISIAQKERRYSFTQYAPGALFRWVDNDFQTANDYYASLSEKEKVAQAKKNSERWEFGLSLLPTLKAPTAAS